MATILRTGSGDPSFSQVVTLTVSSIPPGNYSQETYTVKGVLPEQAYIVRCIGIAAGVFLLDNPFATAVNTLQITYLNTTGSTYNPGTLVFQIYAP